MAERICAVVVTFNRKALLPLCLNSLLAQTRPLDAIVVIDNASTDGTRELLDRDYPQLNRVNLPKNTGGAGGFKAGMAWALNFDFDWVWVMDDDIEMKPECLENMLSWKHIGDMIHVRKQMPWGPLVWEAVWDVSSASVVALDKDVSFANGRKWTAIQYANFEGSLMRREVIEKIGLPDERFFIASDDTLYGYLASQHFSVIYVDYIGIVKKAVPSAKSRLAFYAMVRNRFLAYTTLRNAGVPIRRSIFLFHMLMYTLQNIREAMATKTKRVNVFAAVQGLRDGLHGRFGPPPWM